MLRRHLPLQRRVPVRLVVVGAQEVADGQVAELVAAAGLAASP